MRTILFSFLALMCAANLQAQDKQVMDSLQKTIDKASSALKEKQYSKATCLYNEAMVYAGMQDDKAVPKYVKNNVNAICFYNLACIYSLSGRKEAALNAFQAAVNAGYKDFRHALSDTDLRNIQNETFFKDIIRAMKQKYDKLTILKNSGAYRGDAKDAKREGFTYLDQNDPRLVSLRKTLNLDSIAGNGDEISQIKNLCLWVHNAVRHDGGSNNPKVKNTLALLKVCRDENRGINCRMMATMLNECYLAMGFKARAVTCRPQDENDPDCHVVNIVWSRKLDKWIMADPTFYAFFSDKKGNLLGLGDTRQMMIEGKTVRVNPEANWNGKKKDEAEYLDYMAKNLYWFHSPMDFTYDTETPGNGPVYYAQLLPGDFKSPSNDYITRDPAHYWARPE